MRDLCKVHNLVLGPDGTCVVCRRPPEPIGLVVSDETEALLSRIITAALGACLALAAGALVYVSQLDEGYTGPVTREVPVELEPAQPSAQPVRAPERAAVPKRAPPPLPPARVAATAEGVGPTRQVRVVMYSAPWCYVCDRARDFLSVDAVDLVERDVESDPAAARALTQLNPLQTLPTFEVLGETQVGFSPVRLEAAVRSGLAVSASHTTQEAHTLSQR